MTRETKPHDDMKKRFATLVSTLLIGSCSQHSEPQMAMVSGRVTDYDGNPLAGVTVDWKNPAFDGAYFTQTDSAGRYCVRIPKGRYAWGTAIDRAEYPNAGSTLPEADQRLEYWMWNCVIECDTTLDLRYHRLEVYGVNAFQVQGAAPGYTLYFRPMSLTRHQAWLRAGTPAGDAGLAPDIGKARIEVEINGAPVRILMRQQVREWFGEGVWSGAYLLFVERPKEERPKQVFRIFCEDTETGDKGEATYCLEERGDSDFVRPEGEIDATYRH